MQISVDEFRSSSASKKLFLLNYFDIEKELIYEFALDMCKKGDWLFVLSVITNGRVSRYFTEEQHFDKDLTHEMMELMKDHELVYGSLKHYYDKYAQKMNNAS